MGKTSEITIGAMRPEDLDQVLAIEEASFSMPWSRHLFLRELASHAVSFSLAAFTEGEGRRTILGYLIFWIVADELHILNLATAARCRRQGIAKQLVLAALRVGAAKGAATAYLEVRASNTAAQKLYSSLGFTGAALRRAYYESPVEDAVLMTLSPGAFSQAVKKGFP